MTIKDRKIENQNVQDIVSLTPLQEGMLFHYLHHPENDYYFEQLALDLRGNFNLEVMKQAWNHVVETNEMLRTIFRWEKLQKPVQIILKNYQVPLRVVDLTALRDLERSEAIKEIKQKDRQERIDLSTEPFRITLVKLSENECTMIISNHHIIYDGWSNGIILKEFFQAYQTLLTGKSLHSQKKNSFKEFIKWLGTQERNVQMNYWTDYLAGFDLKTMLPVSRECHSVETGFGRYQLKLSAETVKGLYQFATEKRITPATVLYTVWGILLQRYNNSQDVIFGTTVSGRNAPIADIEEMVGLFINTIPLRVTTTSGESIQAFLQKIDQSVKERTEYESVPLPEIKLCSLISPQETLFDSIVVIENYPLEKSLNATNHQLQIESFTMSESTSFDLTLAIEMSEQICIDFLYDTAKFTKTRIQKIGEHFSNILTYVLLHSTESVGDIELLSLEEKQQVIFDFNATKMDYPRDKTVIEIFEEVVRDNPDHTALVLNTQRLTYAELNAKANQLARLLREKGVQPNQLVGIMVQRSIEMLIGIWGILKAGGAYLPLDPTSPIERSAYMLKDSQTTLLLTLSEVKELIPEDFTGTVIELDRIEIAHIESSNLHRVNTAEDLAYVIYTSGTTGRPKGTLINHYNVNRLVKNTNYLNIDESDRMLQLSNYVFDGSVFDIFSALLNGATLVLVPKEMLSNLDLLSTLIKGERITQFLITTALFNALVETYGERCQEVLAGVKRIYFGGERASTIHVKKAFEYLGAGRLINLYGPTESTVVTTYYPIEQVEKIDGGIPIGKPISNTRVYIMTKDNQLQPIGAWGELCISGDGVARGYLHQSELTAEKFCTTSVLLGERLYKTGDLACWREDGNLEFGGRIDKQVQIRGFRIELAEIETQLLSFDEVKEAAVVDWTDQTGNVYLAAYFVAKREISENDLRLHLGRVLPQYMIPTYFQQLKQLPLTSNGKLDIKALPKPDVSGWTQEYVPPRNLLEERLANIWSEVLGVECVGIEDNFFELGGHSLKATILAGKMHREFDREVPISQIFQTPTIKGISEYLHRIGKTVYDTIEKVEENDYYETSSAQKRMYMLQQLDVESTGYNITGVIEIEGNLEFERVERVFSELILRHEALRTSFVTIDDEILQRVDKMVEFKLEIIEKETSKDFVRAFDLNKAPLFRVGIEKVAVERHILICDMHHIIADGTSMNILINDFVKLYEGEAVDELRIQYKDFAAWQNNRRQTDIMQKQEEYWLKNMSGELPILNLPIDYSRPTIQSFAGDTISCELDPELVMGVKRVVRETGSTMYMVLLSAFNILLGKYTGQEDIIIGSPIAGRTHSELDKIIGMFVNTLAMRNHPEGVKTYAEFLREVKDTAFAAYEHQEYQFEELVEKLNLTRDMSRNPLFDVMFAMDNLEISEFNSKGLRMLLHEYNSGKAKFDLTLSASETSDHIRIHFEYCTKLFKQETIKRMCTHYINILKTVTADSQVKLEEIDMLSAEEKKQILEEFNDTAVNYPQNQTVHELFEAQVVRTPSEIAVVYNNSHLTYQELNQKANQLADRLLKLGVKPDQIVGIFVEPSFEMIIGLLGILKAGGAYLPIEPRYPAERIEYMLQNGDVQILITQKHLQSLLGKVEFAGHILHVDNEDIYFGEANNLPHTSSPENLAYVIYTSGSTGRPKGVMIEHRNVTNLINWYGYRYGLKPGVRLLQMTNYSFDPSIEQIFGSLIFGASIYLIERHLLADEKGFTQYMEENQIQIIDFVPTPLKGLLLKQPDKLSSLEIVICGGERLEESFKEQILQRGYKLHNHYGPTETTIDAAAELCSEGKVLLGRPIANMQCYILDRKNNLLPVGVVGELWIGGVGVGRGYLNNPELTKERFCENPFVPGDRIYKSGDLARWEADGRIDFLGRMDHQVKIRGFRIELGEIENQLLSYPEITSAIVVDRVDQNGDKYLCAYVVSTEELTIENLRAWLLKRLPEYMVPAYFVKLEQLPVNANGKVDRKALPEPENQISIGTEYEAPRNIIEEKLVNIWKETLGVEQIGINDNYFALGGHSLKATALVARIRKEFAVEISLSEIFKTPTIKGLSAYIQSSSKSVYEAIKKVEEKDYYVTSSAQKRMYLLQQFDLHSTGYNMPGVLKIAGRLDIDKVEQAFKKLISRHESLRTSFVTLEDHIVQSIATEVEFAIEYVEISQLMAKAAAEIASEKSELTQRIAENKLREDLQEFWIRKAVKEFVRYFDLSKAPLFRVGVVKVQEMEYLLMFDMHHIISDGISMAILINEFRRLYEEEELEPLRLQYKDYAEWQNKLLQSEIMRKQEEYWLNRFADEIPILNLPTDYPRPMVQSYGGETINCTIERELAHQLKELAQKTDSTLYMILLSGIDILLAKYTGQEDIIVGSPIAGRPHADLTKIIGIFVNTLVLRNQPEGKKTYEDFLQEVRVNALAAFENQDYQFEDLVDRLNLHRDLSRNSLFDVMFALENMEQSELQFGNVKVMPYQYENKLAKFDLTFFAHEAEEGIVFNLEYSTRLFKRETIERMFTHLRNIYTVIVANLNITLSEIDMLSMSEKTQLISTFNATQREYPRDKTLFYLFEEQVENHPDKIALVFLDKRLTYLELNQRANCLANRLREEGVKEDTVVGILTERSLEMIIGILAIIKAGGAYLPLDPDYPKERIKFMMDDCSVNIVLAQGNSGVQFDSSYRVIDILDENLYMRNVANLPDITNPRSLAYVIYTSGSTGQPKGVMVEHRAIIRLVKNISYAQLAEDEKILQTGTLSFDVSTYEIWGVLLNGSELHIGMKELILNKDSMAHYLESQKITSLFLTTALFNYFADAKPDLFKTLRYVVIGGEAASLIHIQRVKRACHTLDIVNGYGPTENTTFSTAYVVNTVDVESVPIGKPIENSTCYILDQYHNLCPIGVCGELWVGGDGLARGYINNPQLTEEKFVVNMIHQGERLYRTGDLARWLPDGNIEFLGRLDYQVKIRGFRIEPGEIEKAILQYEDIKEAVVIDRKDDTANKYLCAYIVGVSEVKVAELRDYLAKNLPDYMIPAYFVQLEKMPLNRNGKVDRKALPEPEDFLSGAEYEAPRNEVEAKLVTLWAEVLGVEKIGINDNFFELGGHSLKATLLTSKIHKEFNVVLPLREIFRQPTIKALAEYLLDAQENLYSSIQPCEEREYYPASSAQKRLYVQCQFEGTQVSYNMPGAVILEGNLEGAKLEQVFNQLVQRHETLRTSFVMVDGEVVQKVLKEADFTVSYSEVTEADVQKLISEFVQPFDLATAPLLRVGIAKLAEKKHILFFDMHHIISDGVSMEILVREFVALYQGMALPELRVQYKDFAVWQNELFKTEIMENQEKYWLTTFAKEIPVLNMPTDYLRPSLQSFSGSQLSYTLDQELEAQLEEMAVKTGSSLYMVFLAAFNVLLAKYTGQDDLIVGSPIAGRRHADLQNIIGVFVNMLALRNTPCSDKTFSEFLGEVKDNTLQAFENQDYQFDELVEKLTLKRDLSRNPLFDVVFALQDATRYSMSETEDLRFIPYTCESNISKFDLTLEVVKEVERMWFSIEYCTDLFTQATVDRLASHYLNILKQIIENADVKLGDIDLLSAAEKKQIITEFNATQMEYPMEKTLHELFAEQVAQTPERTAIIFDDEKLTYAELNARANQLAHRLRNLGIGKEEIVALMMERSSAMLIGIMGVLKAGAAYMPVDPDYPMERITYMLRDSQARVMLTHNLEAWNADDVMLIDLNNCNLELEDDTNLVNLNTAGDLAYVMYTSGSTGKPKGVMIEHRGVVSLSTYYNAMFDLEQKRVLHMSNVSFDTSVVEIFPPLIFGATIYIIRKELALDRLRFIEFVRDNQIHFAQFVPMMLQEILGESPKLESLETVIVGGDKLDDAIKDHILSLGYRLTNHYGPTEGTVDAIVARCALGRSTIGKPIANMTAYILDKDNHPTPIGVPGELCITGVGLARGYLNRPDLTLEKFVANPLILNERMYRTGDLACWQPDGNITFLGRIDNQVKIRGYRIELGEIEELLLKIHDVQSAVVIDKMDAYGGKYLCAYLVVKPMLEMRELNVVELKESLSKELPDYMIPSYFVQIDHIPLTHNGKVDREALPDPEVSSVEIEYVAPINELEEKLVALWQEVLGLEKIGTMHNFFELGGHSLKAMGLVSKIHKELNVVVPFTEVFKSPTIKELARYIQKADKNIYAAIQPVEEREYYPVSSAQRRIYIQWQLAPESKSYNMPSATILEGELDKDKFELTIQALIKRHEALRTSFAIIDGEPAQRIHKDVEFKVDYREAREEQLAEFIEKFIEPFDLGKASLLRVMLIHFSEQRYLLLFDMHHIISDGVSLAILNKDFANLYASQELAPLRIQYKDYAAWHNAYMESETMQNLAEYWMKKLENFAYTELPVSTMQTQQQPEGNLKQIELDEGLTKRINEFCQKYTMTRFAFLLGVFKVILMKAIKQDDLTIGIPVAGRGHEELENMLGIFLNVIVLRTQIKKEVSFKEYLLNLRDDLMDAQEHQDYPYESLYVKVRDEWNYRHNSLFSILFNYMPYQEEEELVLDGITLRPYPLKEIEPKYSLTLYVSEGRENIMLNALYNSNLDDYLVEIIMNSFSIMIESVLENEDILVKQLTLSGENNLEQFTEDFDMEFENDDFF